MSLSFIDSDARTGTRVKGWIGLWVGELGEWIGWVGGKILLKQRRREEEEVDGTRTRLGTLAGQPGVLGARRWFSRFATPVGSREEECVLRVVSFRSSFLFCFALFRYVFLFVSLFFIRFLFRLFSSRFWLRFVSFFFYVTFVALHASLRYMFRFVTLNFSSRFVVHFVLLRFVSFCYVSFRDGSFCFCFCFCFCLFLLRYIFITFPFCFVWWRSVIPPVATGVSCSVVAPPHRACFPLLPRRVLFPCYVDFPALFFTSRRHSLLSPPEGALHACY